MPLKSWSTTDADNDDADAASNINWPEGQPPSGVNNSARAMMTVTKKWWDDTKGGTLVVATAGGTADAITLTTGDGVASLAKGVRALFTATGNNTGAVTVNLDSLGATALKQFGAALPADAIVSGDTCLVVYDGTDFELLYPVRTPYLAANSIFSQGGSAGRATETSIAEERIVGRITSGSITGLTQAQVRTFLGFEKFTSTQQTMNDDSTITVAHSLTAKPTKYWAELVCTDAGGDLGYAQNETVMMVSEHDNDGDAGITISADGTNVYLVMGAQIRLISKSTFNATAIDESKWAWLIHAEYWS